MIFVFIKLGLLITTTLVGIYGMQKYLAILEENCNWMFRGTYIYNKLTLVFQLSSTLL